MPLAASPMASSPLGMSSAAFMPGSGAAFGIPPKATFDMGNPFGLPASGIPAPNLLPTAGLDSLVGGPFSQGGLGSGFGFGTPPFMPNMGVPSFPVGGLTPGLTGPGFGPGIVPGLDRQTQKSIFVDRLFVGIIQSLVQAFMWRQQQKKVIAAKAKKQEQIDAAKAEQEAKKQQALQARQQQAVLQQRRSLASQLSQMDLSKLPEHKRAVAEALIAKYGGAETDVADQSQYTSQPRSAISPLSMASTIDVPQGSEPPSYAEFVAMQNATEDAPTGDVSNVRQRIASSGYQTASRMNTRGKCATGVGDALRAIGIDVKRMGEVNPNQSAYNMAEILDERDDFEEVDYNDMEPGDVLVFGANNKHVHGHTSIYLGNGQESSDCVRNVSNPNKYSWAKAYRYVGQDA